MSLGSGCCCAQWRLLAAEPLSCLQAFSITMLAWIGLQYPGSFQATNSYSALLSNVRCAACLRQPAYLGNPCLQHLLL